MSSHGLILVKQHVQAQDYQKIKNKFVLFYIPFGNEKSCIISESTVVSKPKLALPKNEILSNNIFLFKQNIQIYCFGKLC